MAIQKAVFPSNMMKLIQERKEFISKFQSELDNLTLIEAVVYWRDIERLTYVGGYRMEMLALLQNNIIPTQFTNGEALTIGAFRHLKHIERIDYIKNHKDWPEIKKQKLTECYNEFIEWLDRISFGMFKANSPKYQLSLRAMSNTLTYPQWRAFIERLERKNRRDFLIALVLMQGEKRISQALSLTLNQVNFENNTITFHSKTRQEEIKYEETFMRELKEYVDSTADIRNRKQTVFLTRNGKPVTRLRLNQSFSKASKEAKIKNITPDSLRGTYKMFRQQGYHEYAIMHSKRDSLSKFPEKMREFEDRIKEKQRIYENLINNISRN